MCYFVPAISILMFKICIPGEFGIVYKGYLVHQYIDEVVAIKTLKGIDNNNDVFGMIGFIDDAGGSARIA